MLASARERDPYVIQASIAACHARAASADVTDWHEIVDRYDELLERSPSPVIELNRAIAVGMRDSPDAGLAILDRLGDAGPAGGGLAGYRWLPIAQGDLLRRAGRRADAAARFREALALTGSEVERAELERRLADLET